MDGRECHVRGIVACRHLRRIVLVAEVRQLLVGAQPVGIDRRAKLAVALDEGEERLRGFGARRRSARSAVLRPQAEPRRRNWVEVPSDVCYWASVGDVSRRSRDWRALPTAPARLRERQTRRSDQRVGCAGVLVDDDGELCFVGPPTTGVKTIEELGHKQAPTARRPAGRGGGEPVRRPIAPLTTPLDVPGDTEWGVFVESIERHAFVGNDPPEILVILRHDHGRRVGRHDRLFRSGGWHCARASRSTPARSEARSPRSSCNSAGRCRSASIRSGRAPRRAGSSVNSRSSDSESSRYSSRATSRL
jgi:hypothetical protein